MSGEDPINKTIKRLGEQLFFAIYESDYPRVKTLLGQNVTVDSAQHCTGASLGASLGTLLTRIRNEKNQTPLMVAASNDRLPGVRILIEAGASLDLTDSFGRTALMLAAIYDHLGTIRLLIEAGADVNFKSSSGMTALMIAASNDRLGIVRTLIENGANLDLQDNRGWTALFWAANTGSLSVVRYLLRAGATVDSAERCLEALLAGIQDSDMKTAYDYSYDDEIKTIIGKYLVVSKNIKALMDLRANQLTYFSRIPNDLVGLIRNELKHDPSLNDEL